MIFLFLHVLSRFYSDKQILNTLLGFKKNGLHFRGLGGMSNIILGYYSSAYLSIIMKRYYKFCNINNLKKYYCFHQAFFTNDTCISSKYITNISQQEYILFKPKKNIYISTFYDILESCIELCLNKITRCYFINIYSTNILHEIYKLRKKLLYELLPPNRKLTETFKTCIGNRNYFLVGIHIRTAIYSDFGENERRFYNNHSKELYFKAINYVITKYDSMKLRLYIISDSSKIRDMFSKKYKKYLSHCDINKNKKINHNINEVSVKEQYILSKCNVIIGSCASTFTLLSVFRYLHEFYAIEGVNYPLKGKIKGKCCYKLDSTHHIFMRK